MAELPEGIETMIMGIVDQLSFDVEIFNTNIEKAVAGMVANGMSDGAIKAAYGGGYERRRQDIRATEK